MLRPIFCALRCAPLFWFYVFRDLGKYIQRKGWHDFNYWGLHLFQGKFGGGKTISMVRRAYNICKTHHGVTILTNLTLKGFPNDTRIIKLVNSEQIRDLPDKSIVLIDEIGTIFNSRDFASSKKSVPKPVYQVILQCRHRRVMLLGSVQRWNLLVPIFKLPPPSTFDDDLLFTVINSMKLSTGHTAKTIYLGVVHESPSSIRIYDKFAEQQVKGAKLPSDLNHWVRLELELHEKNSMAVFSRFLDCKDIRDFSKYISRCIYYLIRFIEPDHSRTYNCTVCDWWMKFLESVDGSGMYINKLSTNKFLGAKRYLLRISAFLAAVNEIDPDYIYRPFILTKSIRCDIIAISKATARVAAWILCYKLLSV